MTQQQRKQKLNGKLTDLRVRVAFTSIKSLEREATKLASDFSVYAEELEREAEAQRIRADKAELERDKLKRIMQFMLHGPCTTKDEMRYVIHTACETYTDMYPEELEGSNTDAKRD